MSEPARTFPVLLGYFQRRVHPDCPRSVPWSFIAPHRSQAEYNHSQTLERLAERGGLDPSELQAVVEGRGFETIKVGPDALAASIAWLQRALAALPP